MKTSLILAVLSIVQINFSFAQSDQKERLPITVITAGTGGILAHQSLKAGTKASTYLNNNQIPGSLLGSLKNIQVGDRVEVVYQESLENAKIRHITKLIQEKQVWTSKSPWMAHYSQALKNNKIAEIDDMIKSIATGRTSIEREKVSFLVLVDDRSQLEEFIKKSHNRVEARDFKVTKIIPSSTYNTYRGMILKSSALGALSVITMLGSITNQLSGWLTDLIYDENQSQKSNSNLERITPTTKDTVTRQSASEPKVINR